MFREAGRLEEQQTHYRDNLVQQLEERASSAVTNMLLAIQEVKESLGEKLASLDHTDLPRALSELKQNNQLVRETYAWSLEKGFWFPESRASFPGLPTLPWMLPTGIREIAPPSPLTTLTWSIAPDSNPLVNRQVNARQTLKNLSRYSPYEIQIQTRPEIPASIRDDTVDLSTPSQITPPVPQPPVRQQRETSVPVQTRPASPSPQASTATVPSSPAPSSPDSSAVAPDPSPQATRPTAPHSEPPAPPAPTTIQTSTPAPFTRHSGWVWTTPSPEARWLAWAENQNREVVVLEVDTTRVVESLYSFVPYSHLAGEQFMLTRQESWPLESQYEDTLITGTVSLGSDFPGWQLVYQSTFVADNMSPDMIRWLGSMLVAGILFFVGMGGIRLRQQLSAARQEARHKADFIANVSHELKSPLTTIQLYTEMLESNRIQDPSRKTEYLSTIHKETERLGRLLDNLLNQNRLERDQLNVQPVPMDVRQTILDFCSRVRPTVEQAGLCFESHVSPQPLRALADPDAVLQILTNLTDNALKYAAEGGELLLDAETGIRGIHISVKDRGPGVAYTFRKHLFSPFERADNALTTRKAGMGIGLSISQGQARAMGGELIYSSRKGGGSVFTLLLKPVSVSNDEQDPSHR